MRVCRYETSITVRYKSLIIYKISLKLHAFSREYAETKKKASQKCLFTDWSMKEVACISSVFQDFKISRFNAKISKVFQQKSPQPPGFENFRLTGLSSKMK